mgnify:FL=1
MPVQVVATNRKAQHDYHIIETVEAGMVLTGSEIKSVRLGRITLGDAYVKSERGEMWLLNVHISRYDAASYMGHEPTRARKLLLHRKQIREITAKIKEKGYTLIPLRLYVKDSYAKLEIALAKGKKQYDKREAISDRDNKRHLDRVMKTRSIKGR